MPRFAPKVGVVTRASLSATLSTRTLATPYLAWRSSAGPIPGLRRSASIRITLWPAVASDEDRLIAVVVFPSAGEDPVTRIACDPEPDALRDTASVPRSVR